MWTKWKLQTCKKSNMRLKQYYISKGKRTKGPVVFIKWLSQNISFKKGSLPQAPLFQNLADRIVPFKSDYYSILIVGFRGVKTVGSVCYASIVFQNCIVDFWPPFICTRGECEEPPSKVLGTSMIYANLKITRSFTHAVCLKYFAD